MFRDDMVTPWSSGTPPAVFLLLCHSELSQNGSPNSSHHVSPVTLPKTLLSMTENSYVICFISRVFVVLLRRSW